MVKENIDIQESKQLSPAVLEAIEDLNLGRVFYFDIIEEIIVSVLDEDNL